MTHWVTGYLTPRKPPILACHRPKPGLSGTGIWVLFVDTLKDSLEGFGMRVEHELSQAYQGDERLPGGQPVRPPKLSDDIVLGLGERLALEPELLVVGHTLESTREAARVLYLSPR